MVQTDPRWQQLLTAFNSEIEERVPALNQVFYRPPRHGGDSDEQTVAVREAAQRSGDLWFGPTVWHGRPAFRLSLSSWRTTDEHVDRAVALLTRLRQDHSR